MLRGGTNSRFVSSRSLAPVATRALGTQHQRGSARGFRPWFPPMAPTPPLALPLPCPSPPQPPHGALPARTTGGNAPGEAGDDVGVGGEDHELDIQRVVVVEVHLVLIRQPVLPLEQLTQPDVVLYAWRVGCVSEG